MLAKKKMADSRVKIIGRGMILIGIAVFSIYVLILSYLYVSQEKLIFFPQQLTPIFAADLIKSNRGVEEIKVVTADGVGLHGWLIKQNALKVL